MHVYSWSNFIRPYLSPYDCKSQQVTLLLVGDVSLTRLSYVLHSVKRRQKIWTILRTSLFQIRYEVNSRLFYAEEKDLFDDLHSLHRNSTLRRVPIFSASNKHKKYELNYHNFLLLKYCMYNHLALIHGGKSLDIRERNPRASWEKSWKCTVWQIRVNQYNLSLFGIDVLWVPKVKEHENIFFFIFAGNWMTW